MHQPWKSRLFAQIGTRSLPPRDEYACRLLITFELSTNSLCSLETVSKTVSETVSGTASDIDELRQTYCRKQRPLFRLCSEQVCFKIWNKDKKEKHICSQTFRIVCTVNTCFSFEALTRASSVTCVSFSFVPTNNWLLSMAAARIIHWLHGNRCVAQRKWEWIKCYRRTNYKWRMVYNGGGNWTEPTAFRQKRSVFTLLDLSI